ncbi:MAG: rRNA (adenine-N6)-dimethyltransferase [Micromonosporaceae bacterium]|nr:rRNA (adenine-N6)-dimethyltransferase [Micromonosporaceae bacterium]
MSGRNAAPPGRSGAHFLRPRFAAEIVRSTGVGPHDLVLDLGAGLGALTAPLAATGARVIAVEREPSYARRLTARFADWPGVRVVSADLLAVPLPRRPFRVVANIPFATTAALLRRLLDGGVPSLLRADLVVEYGVAKRLTGPPRDGAARRVAVRNDIQIVRALPPACFRPPPGVTAALVVIRPYPLSPAAARRLTRLLALVDRQPGRAVRKLVPGPVAWRAVGIDPAQPAGSVTPQGWRALVMG